MPGGGPRNSRSAILVPRRWRSAIELLALAALAGCGSGPQRISTPDWDPSELAERAISDLDANDDGQLDAAELAKAPGLAAGVRHIDQNNDGNLSADEIQARFELIADERLAVRARGYHMTYHGRPLVGAEVRFVPESFLEGVIEPAEGVTDHNGLVYPSADIASLRSDGLSGLRIGYYRVEATSQKTPLPAKFNETTTLGVEVGLRGDDGDPMGVIEFPLED